MERNGFYFYNAVIQFIVEDESGKIKKVKENYLVKGVSITDAETQIAEDLSKSSIDYRILSVTESKIIRIIKPKSVELND